MRLMTQRKSRQRNIGGHGVDREVFMKFTLERQVDDYVENELENKIRLSKTEYGMESNMNEHLKSALKGGAKTNTHTNFGIPDYNITKYSIPVLIENKLHSKYLLKRNSKNEISSTSSDIKKYAVNGALHYGRTIIASHKYNACIIVGIAGDSDDYVEHQVYYVFAAKGEPKRMTEYDDLHFLATPEAFKGFLKDAQLTKEEKHKILVKSQQDLIRQAKRLNKMMNNLNISVEQRVVYVSGMLLAMQEIRDYKTGQHIDDGITPVDLKGIQSDVKSDSQLIINQLDEFLKARGNINSNKMKLMMDSFRMYINIDKDRDKLKEKDKRVAKLIPEDRASATKQIFVFLYENIFLQIDANSGSLDIMGSMYSEFLKYALSDGASLGKVLTPPYITNLMAEVLDVSMDDHVMDLATGSGAFLVSSMKIMIDKANNTYGLKSKKATEEIEKIKCQRLLGIELDSKMYTLAASNMILRGDGSSRIEKADSFEEPPELYNDFGATKLLLNPPFSYSENGMPFLAHGLKFMKKYGKAAIIIQDSAGSGKAAITNKKILKHNTMLASIKMPADLFVPNAIVSTSIYIFEAGIPHDFDKAVKFIDFRNDGYKRTKRGISEIDHPAERYSDLLLLLKSGLAAETNSKFHKDLWNLNKQYIESAISDSGSDWNFENHQIIDTTPHKEDFENEVQKYLSFKMNYILNRENKNDKI